MVYTKKTICPYDCPTSCGLLVYTDGNRIIKTEGDKEHPVCQGLICRKMQQYQQSVHSEKRILTPMKRVGEKGEGKFTPITWEEAAKEIAERFQAILKEEGGDAILPIYYSGVMSVIQRKCGEAFFNRLGACDPVFTLCSSAKGAGYAAVMGDTGCLEPRQLENSDFYIIWGSNIKATRLQVLPTLLKARKEGKRVLLIEACARDSASFCDETLLIRPGTDGALALAMMHVLVKEQLADEEFLRSHAYGYETFCGTLKEYTPAWAEEITGIPAERIQALSREFGAAKAPAILLGSGLSRYGNGGMSVRLITILSTFTGAWGRPGGGLCGCNTGAGPYVDTNRVRRPDFRKRAGRRVNINQLSSALTGGAAASYPPVKALFVYGGNPVNSVCNQQGILDGLRRPDLFTVVHERFMTDTALYADILLPATFSVEQTDCYTAYGYCTFGTAKKVIEPAGQCKSNWDTFRLLAEAMGFEDAHFKRTEEDMLKELLAHPASGLQNISEEQWQILRDGGVISTPFADYSVFSTPSGKIQIVNESLKEAMPAYTPAYGGEYPLKLIAVPDCHTLNSIFLEREALVEKRGPAALLLHPKDARERGIQDGDKILAFNDLGQVEFTACITPLIAERTAAASGVYTSKITGTALLVNALNHERLSDIGEATTLNDNTINIRKL